MRIRFPERSMPVLIAAFFMAFCGVSHGENIDPDDTGYQYAFGENVGWLNAEPGGDGADGVEVWDSKLTGYIWAENIGWVSLSCENTSSCGTVDYGVHNDGRGNLSGYAWAENVGWISFSCGNTGSCGTVDYGVITGPTTGEFSGFAWSENVGWINFKSNGAIPFGVKTAWRGWAGAYPSLFDRPSDLELLRQYRDERLTRTDWGRRYTELLYKHSTAALKVLVDNPYLMSKARDLIGANKEAIRDAVSAKRAVIDKTDEIASFLEAYAKAAPPALRSLANKVKREMLRKQRTGEIFLDFELNAQFLER
jgi:hypothetical protein